MAVIAMAVGLASKNDGKCALREAAGLGKTHLALVSTARRAVSIVEIVVEAERFVLENKSVAFATRLPISTVVSVSGCDVTAITL